jgi:predicted RNA-binding Zn-ribbon protein involved in translation (DUF1610 family)
MLVITSATPQFCPKCGLVFHHTVHTLQDLYAGAPHTCPNCGLRYIWISKELAEKLFNQIDKGELS